MGKEPAHHELSDYDVLMRVVDHGKAFLRRNGLHLLLAALVLMVAVVLYRTHRLRGLSRVDATWELLGSLDDPAYLFIYPPEEAEQARAQALAAVGEALENTGDKRAMPWLLLKQASLLAAGRQWDEALEVYRRILRRHAAEAPAKLAEPAMAVVLEAAGRYAEAAALHDRLAAGLVASRVHAGRCRELAGDLKGAEASYRSALEAGLSGGLRELAESRLAALSRGEALKPPPEEPEPGQEGPPLIVPADSPAGGGLPPAAEAEASESPESE